MIQPLKTDVISIPHYNLQSRDNHRQRNGLLHYNLKLAKMGEKKTITGDQIQNISKKPCRENNLQITI